MAKVRKSLLMPPGMIRGFLIGFKSVALVMTLIILILSAVPPKDVTVDHIWRCNDSPQNECARLIIIPILLCPLILLMLIGGLILVALDVTTPLVIWVDILMAVLACVIWWGGITTSVAHVSFNLQLPSPDLNGGDKIYAGYNSNWIAALILATMVPICHMCDAGMRWRQYILFCLQSVEPLPYHLDGKSQGTGTSNTGQSSPSTEQREPIVVNQEFQPLTNEGDRCSAVLTPSPPSL